MDTVPGDKKGEQRAEQSTISRFSCRVIAERARPGNARIYAAGFDSSRNIFLGVLLVYIHIIYNLTVRFFIATLQLY